MKENRLSDYLDHMQQAATDSCSFVNGYFDINLDVVWDTVQMALPGLLKQMPAVRQSAEAVNLR
jgi:uncharacterized protein with HEPN domain